MFFPPSIVQIDPSEKLDPEVEDILVDIAEDFVESVSWKFQIYTGFCECIYCFAISWLSAIQDFKFPMLVSRQRDISLLLVSTAWVHSLWGLAFLTLEKYVPDIFL